MNTLQKFLASSALFAAVVGVSSTLVLHPSLVMAEERVVASSDKPTEIGHESSGALAHAQALSTAFKQVARKIDPAMVQIDVSRRVVNAMNFQNAPEWREMFPDRDGDGEPDVPPGFQIPRGGPEPKVMGEGSGFVIDYADGYAWIATNNHVASEASEMKVTFADGRVVTGDDVTLVGADPRTDVAVIKVKTTAVAPAKWGDSQQLERGDIVLAFGSPFGYSGSVSQGIVSAVGREVGILRSRQGYENFIQTDAAINPGNSGGPLVNLAGEVIGINTAIASRSGGFNGVGFAIPSNQAKSIIESLRSNGRVVRGYLGVMIRDIGEIKPQTDALKFQGSAGVLVSEIPRNSPATGKLQPDDIIVAINGKDVPNMRELRSNIAATAPDTDVTIKVWRDEAFAEVVVKLGELPEEIATAGGQSRPGMEAPTQPRLGVRLTTPDADALKEAGLPEGTKGVLVTDVMPGSIAMQMGLEAGDVITRVGEKDVTSVQDVTSAVTAEAMKAGVRVRVVNKDGQKSLFYKSE